MAGSPIAFVTGASRGIGAATARALAGAGFDVVVTARTLREGERHDHGGLFGTRPLPGSLEKTSAEVEARGRRALAIRLDLLDPASIDAALERTRAEWGAIDLLVNNGIVQGYGMMERFLDVDLGDYATLLEGNVVAQCRLVQRVLPGMLERGGGAIVNLVSASGLSDPPAPSGEGGWGFAYASSKAAFHRLVGVLAVEHADSGVRFHNLEPGFIVTEMMRETGLEAQFEGRFGGAPPEVPAAVIAWLATDPGAAAWQGKTVFAQKLCKDRALLPGWPPAAD